MIRIFKKRNPKPKTPKKGKHPFAQHLDPGHTVELGFTHDGTDYYRFSNEYNLPFERMNAALLVLQEFELKADLAYVKEAVKAAKTALEGDGKRVKLSEAFRVLDSLEERLAWPFDCDLVYHLAAITFFDTTENPYAYDRGYALAKVNRWRTQDKHAELLRTFFLTLGLEHYLGPFEGRGIDLAAYMAGQRSRKYQHLTTIANLLPSTSAGQRTSDTAPSIMQQASALRELLASAD
jgi:hypothetical protein